MGTFAYIPQATDFPASPGPANYAQDVFDNQNPSLLSPDTPLGEVSSYIDSEGRVLLFKKVKLDSTTFPSSLVIGPVYYKDNTQQVVTTNESEAVCGINSYAGILLNTSAANGQQVWIQVGGYLGADSDTGFGSGPLAPTGGVTKGDMIVGTAGQQVMTDIAAGTAPTYRPIGIVQTTAAAAAAFDIVLTPNYC